MEAIATDAAVDAAKSLIKTMASKAFEEIGLIWGFNDDLERLKKKLSYIEALMEDLGKRKREENRDRVNHWLKDVKEVACFAENLVNDHAYEMLRRKHSNSPFEGDCIYCVYNLIDEIIIKSPIVFRVQMTYRVKEIMSMFDELDKLANGIGLNPVDLANNAVSTTASTSAAADTTTLSQIRRRPPTQVFIGRDKDKRKLVEMMLSSPNTANQLTTNTIPIIAIVGLGGQGKTTLARKLYEGDEGGDWHFDGKKIWICVSENFITFEILKEMVESVTKQSCKADRNTDAVIDILQENLKGKKLFLVLDDVWNAVEELWKSLKYDLNRIGVATGSVILITTRKKDVATAAGASRSHELERLSDEDAMELLKKHVRIPVDPPYVEVVTSILKKCKGVPLAINAIGGILNSKNRNEWHQIEKSDVWSIQHEANKEYIIPSLLLSYNHFNDVSLKQCFACCAIYPKDRVMEKGELISLWLAQGLLHHHDQDKSNNTSTTTIGEKYINILINHSFLLLEKEDDDEVYRTKYKMHDLVHDLATHVLKKDLLVWEAGTNLNDVSRVRHLAVNLKDNDKGAPETVTLPKKEIRKLRTVIFWNYGVSMWKSLNGARYLCTLIIVDIGLEEVPPVIGQLVHLRYLDLSENDDLKSLPESICNLYQLQTLRLLGCWRLKELPRELHKLKNLRHIPTKHPVKASKGLQELTNLQTLPLLELRAEEGWKIDELGPLNQVKGGISISGLNHVKNKEEARKADLGKKDKILQLSLNWDEHREESQGLNNDEDVLEGLEPNPKIQSLSVDGYMGVKFPTGYLTHLSSLTKVKLLGCKNCQQLPSLGQLSNLKTLRIVGFERLTTWAAPSSALEATTAFPSLETLQVKDCPQLETTPYVPLTSLKHVDFRNVGVTHLDMVKGSNGLIELKLRSLQKLRMLPEELSNCSNLQSLEIFHCENLECIPNGLTSLKTLKVKSCPSLSMLPEELSNCSNLQSLEIDDCENLECIPNGLTSLKTLKVETCPSLSMLPEELSNCSNLQSLEISFCENLECIPNGLTSLKTLKVGRCPSLSMLPEELSNCSNLQSLEIIDCENLECIPNGLTSLKTLYVDRCPSLSSIPNDLEDCMSLEDLTIEDCPLIAGPIPDMEKLEGLKLLSLKDAGLLSTSSLRWIPSLHGLTKLCLDGLTEEWDISLISSLTSLTSLKLRNCPNFKALTTQQQALPHTPLIGLEKSLEKLRLFNAGEMMMSAARSIPQLDRLWKLEIGGFKDEEEITKFVSQIKSTPHSHSHSLSLRAVMLRGWPKVKKMPKQLQHLLPSSTLEYLSIIEFDELEQLPDWIGNLSSLKKLWLEDCKKLKYLPSKQAMMHLSELYILDCPELKERCEKHSNNENENDNGPPHSESQWPNIEHIPVIEIEFETIQDLR